MNASAAVTAYFPRAPEDEARAIFANDGSLHVNDGAKWRVGNGRYKNILRISGRNYQGQKNEKGKDCRQ